VGIWQYGICDYSCSHIFKCGLLTEGEVNVSIARCFLDKCQSFIARIRSPFTKEFILVAGRRNCAIIAAMQVTIEQLRCISIFTSLQNSELHRLQPHAVIKGYKKGEVILQEGDCLLPSLYALVSGLIRITKIALTGKETILRILKAGEMFAAPALLGDGIAPATVIAETDCEVVLIEREALLDAVRSEPEIAFKILSVFNHRLQQLHNTVHGLISEKAITRLVRYIQYSAHEYGTETTQQGDCLQLHLPHYQIARSIGITYEECVRLFKQLQPWVSYSRGGKITVKDWHGLEAIASGLGSENELRK
jgi:CRP-like cAMP-binding protein